MQVTGRHRPKEPEKSRKYPLKKILAYGAIAVVVSGVGLYFILDHLIQDAPPDCSQSTVLRAAIVDQLSESQENQTFVDESTALLQQAGFDVDYFDGESVTVNLYRELPTHCYSVILLRVHSASFNPEQRVFDLFTSELYSKSKYVGEQINDQLRQVAFDTSYDPYEEGDPTYFGITHKFICSSMKGEFYNTMIIMMGCEGMKYDDMAQAFIDRGAVVYIAWDKLVTAPHTDQAAIDLLENFLQQEQTVGDAVAGTMAEVGMDKYGGTLWYYPADTANYTLYDILGD
ncbi:MAG: hypothetical protein WBC82_00560 [Dehalococcoidia bacterium]